MEAFFFLFLIFFFAQYLNHQSYFQMIINRLVNNHPQKVNHHYCKYFKIYLNQIHPLMKNSQIIDSFNFKIILKFDLILLSTLDHFHFSYLGHNCPNLLQNSTYHLRFLHRDFVYVKTLYITFKKSLKNLNLQFF